MLMVVVLAVLLALCPGRGGTGRRAVGGSGGPAGRWRSALRGRRAGPGGLAARDAARGHRTGSRDSPRDRSSWRGCAPADGPLDRLRPAASGTWVRNSHMRRCEVRPTVGVPTRAPKRPGDIGMTSTPDTTTLPITKAARLLGVHPNTLRAWADQGRLRCLRVNARGDRRFPSMTCRRSWARRDAAVHGADRRSPGHDGRGRRAGRRLGRADRLHRQARHPTQPPELGRRDRPGHLRRAAASSSTITTCASTGCAARTSCRSPGRARPASTSTKTATSCASVSARASPAGWPARHRSVPARRSARPARRPDAGHRA